MKLNNIGYLLKEGFRSIFQHGFMSFAAICVTVACLIIVGSFSALAYNLDIMVQAHPLHRLQVPAGVPVVK